MTAKEVVSHYLFYNRHYTKMSTIKDTNGMDLQKQKILRRGGKNTQKNYTKKIFMTQIT